MHLLMITVLGLTAVVSADPAVILSGGLVSSPFTSAALIAPAAGPVVAPLAPVSQVTSYPVTQYSSIGSVAQVGPVSQINPVSPVAPVAPLAPVAPVAPVAPLSQLVSDYRYAYGSSYSYQDYFPVVNSALSLPYSLPYAYAADWYYRK